jgi:carbon-monoxide dehydrogenase large subunit
MAVVEVDPSVGTVKILRYVVAEDCGRIVNPMIVDGQVTGGVAQGIGGALLEEIVYDEQGQPLTTSLMDYLWPTALDIPRVEIGHLETHSAFTIGGIKGMGEGGAIAPGAVLAGAVEDALRPLGGGFVDKVPLTPERVLNLVAAVPFDGAPITNEENQR